MRPADELGDGLAEEHVADEVIKISHPDPEKQIRVAREVFQVYAPLAHRLGIGQIKWELEDLSFRYLEPEAYMQIARLLDGKRLGGVQHARRRETLLAGDRPRLGESYL